MEKMQLIPARGRLLFAEILLADVLRIQLIPARGRLPVWKFYGYSFPRMQLIPARGRLLKFLDIRFITKRCSLAPRGDSLHMFPLANFHHFIDNPHILCYTSW